MNSEIRIPTSGTHSVADLEKVYMSLDEPIRNSTYRKQYAADLAKWKLK